MTKALSTILIATAILSIIHSAVASPKVVSLPFTKRVREDGPSLRRRQDSEEVAISNGQILYIVNVTVGTPPQPFSLQLDTGSSDTWIASAFSDACAESRIACLGGEFDPRDSSTFVELASNIFDIRYVDGSEIQGDYFADTIVVGGDFKLENVTMGLATTASRGLGLMGIGYSAGESIAALDPDLIYPNIIDELVLQGVINSRAYSLYLDDVDALYGNILFGGVDTNKYSGDLVGLPVQPDSYSSDITSFSVAFTGLSVLDASGRSQLTEDGIAVPAILDSGTTYTFLPDDLANAVLEGVGVTTDPSYGNVVRCQVGREEASFAFEFGGAGGPVIEVELSQLVTPLLTLDGSAPTFDDGAEACSFGIYAAGSDPILFGDSFLRSAYVVYDLENDVIALAQARYGSPDSNVQEFSAGSDIPELVSVASAVEVTQTYSGLLPSQPATGTATGTRVGGTERSATFVFGDPTGEASESEDAAPAVMAPVVEATTIVAGVLVLTSFMFGGGFLLSL